MEMPANLMKMLSDNTPCSNPQEVQPSSMCSNVKLTSLPSSMAPSSDTYATLTTASITADSYNDKQDLNNIFDSLLQKWPAETSDQVRPREMWLFSLYVWSFYVLYPVVVVNSLGFLIDPSTWCMVLTLCLSCVPGSSLLRPLL